MLRHIALLAATFASAIGLGAVATAAASGGRTAYYATHYPGEHGPYSDRREAIDAGLVALGERATMGDWGCEWLLLYSRDRYGAWWFSDPKEGHGAGANQCEVTYSQSELLRPGAKLAGTAHNHPRDDVFPDPRPTPPDNQNDHEMFLLRLDGDIWFFPPHETRPKVYGRLRQGVVESRYRGAHEHFLREADDPEAVRAAPRPEDRSASRS